MHAHSLNSFLFLFLLYLQTEMKKKTATTIVHVFYQQLYYRSANLTHVLISVPRFSPTDKLFINSVPLVPFITGSSTIWSCSVPLFRRSATCSVPRFSLHHHFYLLWGGNLNGMVIGMVDVVESHFQRATGGGDQWWWQQCWNTGCNRRHSYWLVYIHAEILAQDSKLTHHF